MNRVIESLVREETFCGCLKPMVFSLMLAMGTAVIAEPVHASKIRADKSAPSNQQPTVLSTANGLPQVNIQTPSAAGVSVNQYHQFDVDSKGAILNNSRKSVQTQTAGWIQGNPWLAGGEARVIVNQVNSANPSLLNGYIEVGGRRAEVVLANPAGIQVNGGGFINANKVDLVGAVPFIRNGQLNGFGAYSGKVGIAGQGLDVHDADYTRILANAVQADGGIWAKDLQVEGTAAIDTGKLGGMYADKIILISRGSDVRNAGQVFAAAGGVSISADGKLANSGTIAASGTAAGLRVKSGALDNSGTLSAQGDVELNSDTLSNSGTVLSAAQLLVRNNRADNSGRIQAVRFAVESADLHNSGRISQTGLQGLSLETKYLNNRGKIGYPEAETTVAPFGGAAVDGGNTPDAPSTASGGGSSSMAATTVLPHYEAGYIKSAALENSGKIEANGGIDLNSPNGLTNVGELQLNRLTVAGEALDNRKGRIQAQSIEVRARRTDNRMGDLTAAKNLSLHNDELDNHGGKLLSADALTIEAKQLNNSEKGKIAANGAVELRADTFNNQDGNIDADALTLVSGSLNNRRGAIRSNQKSELILSQSLDNRQGKITSAGQLNLRSERTDNTGGTVAADGDVSLQGGSLRNQGTLMAGRDLDVDLKEDFIVEQDIRAGRGLKLASGGRLTNAHSLEAVDGIRLQAAEIDNQTAGKIQAGNRVKVEALGDVRNHGLMNSNGLTKVKAGRTLYNTGTGRIYGDEVELEADAVVNREEGDKAAVVAARTHLNIGARDIENREAALLFSSGDMRIGRALNGQEKVDSLRNRSATIEALDNLHIQAADLSNTNEHLQFHTEETGRESRIEYESAGTGIRYLEGTQDEFGWHLYEDESTHMHTTPGGGNPNWSKYVYDRITTESKITESKPAKILSGGMLKLDANKLYNSDSQILAGGELDVSTPEANIINNETLGTKTITESGTKHNYFRQRHKGRDSTGHWEEPYPPKDTPPVTTSIRMGVWEYKGHTKSQQQQHDKPEVGAIQTTAVAASQNSIRSDATAKFLLPSNSLFTILPHAKGYLIETDPAFANYREWLGSDYMLGRLGLDGDNRHKRLGDGYYEQKLINEQIARLTGYRRLDGYQNDEEQFKALMDSGITAARSMNLVPGIALSAEQVARLTSDIIWLENQTVTLPDGSTQTVLVPQVYVVARKGDLNAAGSLISADQIRLNLKGGGRLDNKGTLGARKIVLAEGGQITSSGHIQAAAVDLDNDTLNLTGGSITADSLLRLKEKQLNVNSTTATSGNGRNGQTVLNRQATLYLRGDENGEGLLSIEAGNANLIGAKLINNAEHGRTLIAVNNLNAGTVKTEKHEAYGELSDRNHHHVHRSAEIGTEILGKGNVRITVKNNATLRQTNMDSSNGILSLAVGNHLEVIEGRRTLDLDEAVYTQSKRLIGKKSEQNQYHLQQDEVVGSKLTGKNVLVTSNGTMLVRGSDIIGRERALVHADGNISITAAQNHYLNEVSLEKRKSGLNASLKNGVAAVGYGKSRHNSAERAEHTGLTLSRIGSIEGNAAVISGGHLHTEGARFQTGNNLLLQGKSTALDAAYEEGSRHTEQSGKQSGISVGITYDPAKAAVDRYRSATQNNQFSNSSVGQIMSKADAGGQAILAATQPVVLNIGSSRYSGDQDTRYRNAVRTEAHAGGNIYINATEGNLAGQGVKFSTDKDVFLNSKQNINLDVAESWLEQDATKQAKGAGFDNRNIGMIGSHNNHENAIERRTQALSSELSAGGNVVAKAQTGNITVRGSSVTAEHGDVWFDAAGDVSVIAAPNTLSRSSNHDRRGIGSAQISDTEQFFGYMKNRGNSGENSVEQVRSRVGSLNGNVNIRAGGTYRQSASDVLAKGDLFIEADKIDAPTLHNRHDGHQTQQDKKYGTFASVSSPILDAVNAADSALNSKEDSRTRTLQTLAAGAQGYQSYSTIKDGTLFKAEIGAGFKSSQNQQQSSESASQSNVIQAGGNMVLHSRNGDIRMQHSNVQAGGALVVDSAKEILLEAGINNRHNEGSSKNRGAEVGVGVSVGAQTGAYVYGEAEWGKGSRQSDEQTHSNTVLRGQTVLIKSKGDTTLRGAEVHGHRIDTDIGGKLHVESLQDRFSQNNKQQSVGGRVQGGYGNVWRAEGHYSQDKGQSERSQVGNQSGLFAGEGGYHVQADSVHLKGGVIHAAAPKEVNELTAGAFTHENIENRSSHQASSTGFAGGSGGFNPSLPQKSGEADNSTSHAVLGDGRISIGGREQTLESLGVHAELEGANRQTKQTDLDALQRKQKTVADATGTIQSGIRTFNSDRVKAADQARQLARAEYENHLQSQNSEAWSAYQSLNEAEKQNVLLNHSEAYKQADGQAVAWGIGGNHSRAANAVGNLVTGLLGGQSIPQALGNAASPYTAAAIGELFGHGEEPNKAAQLGAHFATNALLAYLNGADPVVGGSAGAGAELLAEYLSRRYDDGKTAINPVTGKFDPNRLPEEVKERIASQAAAVVAVGGAVLKDGHTAQVVGVLGKNTVENNLYGGSYASKKAYDGERKLENTNPALYAQIKQEHLGILNEAAGLLITPYGAYKDYNEAKTLAEKALALASLIPGEKLAVKGGKALKSTLEYAADLYKQGKFAEAGNKIKQVLASLNQAPMQMATPNGVKISDHAVASKPHHSSGGHQANTTKTQTSTAPGTPEHKQARWEEYQKSGGKWDYERWSNTYEVNIVQAKRANKARDDYHKSLGWGKTEVTVQVEINGQPYSRRLDIADNDNFRAVEYKTGYQTRTREILWELERDKALVKAGWNIEWVFENSLSQPLMNDLREAGIRIKFNKK